MAHNHNAGAKHGHSHAPANYGRAFAVGVVLNTAFVAVEATFGVLSNSLALVADAGHNLSDVLGLLLAWGASILATRQPTQRRTYGLRRTSILAALLNAVLLLVAVGGISWEAIGRFGEPSEVAGGTVVFVAMVGIAINTATALMFMAGRKNDLNIRGAFMHMAADAGVSLGVVIAGVAILLTGWLWLDPVMSLLIGAVILIGTWGLLRDSVNLALDAVPEGIDAPNVQEYLVGLPSVVQVHDLHIWGMSTTEPALTAHIVLSDAAAGEALLGQATRELHDRYGIEHVTLQLETGETAHNCQSCGPTKIAQSA